MGDLTPNLSRWETLCRCGCGQNTIDFETVTRVQETVDHFNRMNTTGKPYILSVTSGNRCLAYNRKKKSKDTSRHILSLAIDFRIPGVSPQAIYDYLDKKYPDTYGIGLYDTFVHLDCSRRKRRWTG